MKSNNLKLFIIRKYILAKSAQDAIKKERFTQVDDVWVDDDWKKEQNDNLTRVIGFQKSKK